MDKIYYLRRGCHYINELAERAKKQFSKIAALKTLVGIIAIILTVLVIVKYHTWYEVVIAILAALSMLEILGRYDIKTITSWPRLIARSLDDRVAWFRNMKLRGFQQDFIDGEFQEVQLLIQGVYLYLKSFGIPLGKSYVSSLEEAWFYNYIIKKYIKFFEINILLESLASYPTKFIAEEPVIPDKKERYNLERYFDDQTNYIIGRHIFRELQNNRSLSLETYVRFAKWYKYLYKPSLPEKYKKICESIFNQPIQNLIQK